jgi:Mg-chelatase subunit ChlD
MNESITQHRLVEVRLVAHEDGGRRVLLAQIKAAENERTAEAPPVRLAIVLDRSGSMSGRKIDIARSATAQMIRSLGPENRVGVVAFDHAVDVVSPLAPPSEGLAEAVARIETCGSTNLYGGWLSGAKMVGDGGRVILLSDGQANQGLYTDAGSLSNHAGISYRKYGVTTSTVGVGDGYDENLMAGMAREGAGAHYFAADADAILSAFAQERLNFGSVALSRVSLRYGGRTLEAGHLWAGETKPVILECGAPSEGPATLRFEVADTGECLTIDLDTPGTFAYSEEAALEVLLAEVVAFERLATSVTSRSAAAEAAERVRELMMRILRHPHAEQEHVRLVLNRLENLRDRLQRLEHEYDEIMASQTRKLMHQNSYNLRERAKGFSSCAEDDGLVSAFEAIATGSGGSDVAVVVDPRALTLAPVERWRGWRVLPVRFDGRNLSVLMVNSKAGGFILAEIERELRVRVRPIFRRVTEQEIFEALEIVGSA